MKIKPYKNKISDGLFSGMPAEKYHAHENESSSQVRTLLRSPLEYIRQRSGLLPNEPTAAMEYGTVAHSTILENRFDGFHIRPETYGDGKKWNSNATECRAWAEAHTDKPVITHQQLIELKQSADYIRNHDDASKLLSGGTAEVSAFWNGRKARMDYFKPSGNGAIIVDLKTCANATTYSFATEILRRGYHIQAAWYRSVLLGLGFEFVHFYFVALQKGRLPLVNCWMLGERSIKLGEADVEKAMEIKTICEHRKHWPEFNDEPDPNGAPFRCINVPDFALPDETEIEFDGETIAV